MVIADSEVEENILFSLFVGVTSLCSEDVPEYIQVQVQESHTLPVNTTKNRLDRL